MMTETKIKLQKVNIKDNQKHSISLSVQKFSFLTKNGNKEIENVLFEGSPSKGIVNKQELEAILEKGKNQNLELSFDNDKVEIKVIEPQPENSHGCFTMGPEPVDQPLKIRVHIKSKTLSIEWNPDIIKITTSASQEVPKEVPKKPDSPKPETPKGDNPNKGPNNPTPKQPDKSPNKEETPKPQDTPPKNSEPSSEEVNNAKNKLRQARESGDKDRILNAINETKGTVEKSSDQDLKKEKELTENELGKLDEKKLREVIKEEIDKGLQKFGIKADNLSSENKQKLDKLNNNIKPNEAKNIRNKVLNEIATNKINELIAKLEQAIKQKNKKEIESKSQELRQITQDNSEYVQNAYQTQRSKIQQLQEQAKNQLRENNNERKEFFRLNNPLMWLSGVAVIGLVTAIILVTRTNRKK